MNFPLWTKHDPTITAAHLGFIPGWLSLRDPRPAREQLDANYRHGGGWRPFDGFVLKADNSLQYPDDPDLEPLASCQFRDELVVFYPHAFVGIIQKDRSFEVSRMD